MNIIFFGSTTDSVIVLEKLRKEDISAIVTQPPRPVGRNKTITPTPVETWAKKHAIAILSFPSASLHSWKYENEQTVIDTLAPFQADLIISASYGQKIPAETIQKAALGGLNIHPSILPRWRGADPVPWAILSDDHQIGVTVVTLSEEFDQGLIIAQKKIPIMHTDMSDPLRTTLFGIGAQLLADILAKGPPFSGKIQQKAPTPYARKFTRDDGFEPWEKLMDPAEALRIERKFRAFHPWPGLWTRLPSLRSGDSGQALIGEKRLKILEFTDSPQLVQLEGKQPVSFLQFSKAYLTQ